MHVVRSASLRGFAELTRSLGGDPEDLVRRAGVAVEALDSDEVPMADDGAARAMELASRDLAVPDFGLRLSDFQDLGGLGPLALAIRNSPTLGDALEDARRYISFHHQGSAVSVEPDPYEVRGIEGLRFTSALDENLYPQASDNALLNLHRVVLLLANGDYGLRSVELAYRPAAPPERHEEAFGGVRVNLGQALTMLRIPTIVRQLPIADAQATLREIAIFYLADRATPADSAIRVRVRSVVVALLGSGHVSVGGVAAGLGMAQRTLQRRLTEEGTSLGEILSEVREEKALSLLVDPRVRMSELAAALEFANQATLSRAARRWWGMTPTAKRRELLALHD